MAIPDVVIAGAAKTGTTALAMAMQSNEAFFVGHEKEPRFFAGLEPTFSGPWSDWFNGSLIMDQAAYVANFDGASGRRTVDASTDYLNNPGSAAAIAGANPEVRIVIGLRHPVKRAWSEHLHLKRADAEDRSFDESLTLEEQRTRAGWIPLFAHVERSLYFPGVEAFVEAFGHDRVFLYRHERLTSDPSGVLEDLGRFLDVPSPLQNPGTHNVGGVPRSRAINRLVRSGNGSLRTVRRLTGRALPERTKLSVQRAIDRRLLDRTQRPSAEASAWILSRTMADTTATEAFLGLDLADYRRSPYDDPGE